MGTGCLHSATQAVQEIIKRPWGDGIGTSGLASLYNQQQTLQRMPENYYIQVGEETGLIGLLLLLAMIGLSVWQLIRRPAVARFIALGVVAVSICSLFVPAWGGETVAITLWLLAGAALALSGDKLKP